MIKIIIISINFVLAILLMASISWFEQEHLKIEKINKKRLEDIEKLKKISQINLWIESVNQSMYYKMIEKDADKADDNLIKFYDGHVENYNLVIKRFIHEDESSKNMNMLYSVNRNNFKDVVGLIGLECDGGFLHFCELKMDKTTITGEIQMIHLYHGGNNVFK
ncbi:MAG: hypothetical protein Q7S59_03230 [Sulfurimonas sp.]|nr:hypothetical protein [Sulfurimonas sp.]